MSTLSIFMFAIFVFLLMSIGIILTMLEFNRLSDEPSIRKGAGSGKQAAQPAHDEGIRVVHSREDAA